MKKVNCKNYLNLILKEKNDLKSKVPIAVKISPDIMKIKLI